MIFRTKMVTNFKYLGHDINYERAEASTGNVEINHQIQIASASKMPKLNKQTSIPT